MRHPWQSGSELTRTIYWIAAGISIGAAGVAALVGFVMAVGPWGPVVAPPFLLVVAIAYSYFRAWREEREERIEEIKKKIPTRREGIGMMFDDEPRQSLGVLFHVGLAFVLVGLFVAFVEFLVDVAVPYIMAHRPTWWQAVGTFVAFGTGLIIGSLIVRRLAARRARIESVKRKIEDAARQRRY